jgi:hypothetical protein
MRALGRAIGIAVVTAANGAALGAYRADVATRVASSPAGVMTRHRPARWREHAGTQE